MKPEPDTRTRLPPELGPELGVEDNTSTGGTTDSAIGEEGPHETGPHDSARGASPGAEKIGDSQADKDPETTYAAETEPSEPKEQDRPESGRNREPTSQTTTPALFEDTVPGWAAEIEETERNSKAADANESSDEESETTPKPRQEEPMLKVHDAESSPARPMEPITLELNDTAEQEEASPRSEP
jgi:hypothetical protein